jgi:hypothetical protein
MIEYYGKCRSILEEQVFYDVAKAFCKAKLSVEVSELEVPRNPVIFQRSYHTKTPAIVVDRTYLDKWVFYPLKCWTLVPIAENKLGSTLSKELRK